MTGCGVLSFRALIGLVYHVPEMYIEHVLCTDLNQHNVEVPVNLQTYVSPMDRTIFFQEKPTLFDADYEPPQDDTHTGSSTGNTLTAVIGEVSLTEQVKQESDIKIEPPETDTTILAGHSPQCQLRLEISKVITMQQPTRTPKPTDEYSTDSMIQGGIVTLPAHHLDSTSSSNHITESLKDVTLQDITTPSETMSTHLLSYTTYSSH